MDQAETEKPQPPPQPLLVCPNCGRQLQQQACKLRCPDPACGFFLSCSDYQ